MDRTYCRNQQDNTLNGYQAIYDRGNKYKQKTEHRKCSDNDVKKVLKLQFLRIISDDNS